MRLPASADGRGPAAGFLVALAAFLILLGVGVVRRWRRTYWLVPAAGRM